MPARPSLDPTLYLVAGSADTGGRPLVDVVAAAVAGGVTLVQLREKTLPDAEVVTLARALKAVLAPRGVPLVVNDRVDVVRAAGADGVHLGADDMDAGRARAILGSDAVVGVSAGTPMEAAAVNAGAADYAGVGSVYATATKADAGAAIGVAGLKALAARLPLPVVAIGGIGADNAAEVMASGAAAGIAVVSAICGAGDPAAAARALRRAIDAGRAQAG